MRMTLTGGMAPAVILIVVGVGLVVLGLTASPEATTDDGYPLQNFLYLMGGGFIIFPLLLSAVIHLFHKLSSDRKAYLLKEGIRGEAEILDREQTGLYINDQPQIRYLLNVILPDRAPYQVKHKEIVSLINLSSIPRVGQRIPVIVDPSNQKSLLLDYNR